MAKPKLSEEVIAKIKKLRETGHSIPEIHVLLMISKSSISKYVKEFSILPEFRQRWIERRNGSKIISENAWSEAQKRADDVVRSVDRRDLMLIGAALYWAEGAKRDLSFINSDPEMVRLFIKILILGYGVPENAIKVSLRVFDDIPIPDAIRFWTEVTGLNLPSNTSVEVRSGIKKGRLTHGMCRVRVKRGGLLLKTISAINNRVISMAVATPRSSTDRAAAS